ncbi:MAG: signal peptidase II [Lachnospiraceae bacterium]|nr:signal peptidase II [Lachnospiraceae bacterium]
MPFLKKYKALFTFLVFLFAGAVGNFIDRVRFGYVVDFIYFKPINFPVFNLADCFITFACILLLYSIVFIYQEKDFEFVTRQ